MSRVANNAILVPDGIDVSIDGNYVTVKGSKGQLQHNIHSLVSVVQEGRQLKTSAKGDSKSARALAGTTRALLYNFIIGLLEGCEKKMVITGIGYRAQVQGKILDMTLGLSHPVKFPIPEGITIEMPSQTEIVIRGIDKQKVGQVAADIRALRSPEPYKGKGIRYLDEHIIIKQAKKA